MSSALAPNDEGRQVARTAQGAGTAHILKVGKRADLHVRQLTNVERIINPQDNRGRSASTFPIPLLGRADEVIE
jgi:hypothetical protein